MPVNGNIQVTRSVLPEGIAGVDTTVRRMVELAHSQYGSKSAKIRALAIDIVRNAGIKDKDYYGEIVAIHNWVRDNIRYFRDPIGQETLSYPEETAFNSRGGDCLSENTRLLTPRGYVAIKDVKPGDIIQGKKGWTKVLRVWDKGMLPTSTYGLDNGGEFTATDDHRCFLLDGTEKKAGALCVRDPLLGPSKITLTDTVKGEKLSPEDCFFIGLFLADGWEDGNRICIAGKDGFAKEAQKHWVEAYAHGRGWKTSWHARYIRVYLPKDHLLSDLLRTGKLAPEKEIPADVLRELTPAKAERLLTGLLADSHDPLVSRRAIGAEDSRKKRKGRGGVCISTTSPELSKQIRLLLRLTGVSASISCIVDHGGLGTHPINRIYPRYYREKPARVESVEPAGVRHVWDITTEDSGIYLPDADIVVHNCDDMTILEIAMLGSIGMEAYPVVVGMFPNHFSHVYLYAKVPAGKHRMAGQTIPLDPIMKDWDAGREAPNVKAKKIYPHLSNPLTLNGVSMGQDLGSMDVGDLGTYAIAPSYLDQDNSHAGELLIPDAQRSHIHSDKTVANASRVNMPFEGIDRMLGAGDTFTSTSPGDDGTIVESGGQLVPKGFIRPEADIRELMRMDPATSRRTGPLGPIYERKARENLDYLRRDKPEQIRTVASELRDDGVRELRPVSQVVGQKRYTLPTVAGALREQRGLTANPTRPMSGPKVVSISSSMTRDRLGAGPTKIPTLGEQLADVEQELNETMTAARVATAKAIKPQALAHKQQWRNERRRLMSRIEDLEKQLLALRQRMRSTRGSVAAPVFSPEPTRTINGMGDGFMDTIKKPIVWAPVLAFVGIIAIRLLMKKRSSAAATA